MAFSGFGDDDIKIPKLPGAPGKPDVPADVFLIAQLNRFKGPDVPFANKVGDVKFDTGAGISSDVALDALAVVARRLMSSVEALSDEGANQLLAGVRGVLSAGDASGFGDAIKFVKTNVVAIGAQIGAYADSLGLPPADLPIVIAGLSGTKLAVAAGVVGLTAFFLFARGRR